MNKLKKFLWLSLAVVMLLGLIPISTIAAETNPKAGEDENTLITLVEINNFKHPEFGQHPDYSYVAPEGASIYRWKTGKIKPINEERFQYIFDEDLEGLSLYMQRYIFKLDDDINEFEIKLINIDDVNKNYEQVDGNVFKFCLK